MGIDHETAVPDWYAALPVTVAAAGVLFFDESGRVMLVHTSNKDDWDVPGGVIELNEGESPVQAARREVYEELGLDVEVGPLLCVDQVPATPGRRPLMAFLFDGGVLFDGDVSRIRFLGKEITETRFCLAAEIGELALPPLARRLAATIEARGAGVRTPIFLSNGF